MQMMESMVVGPPEASSLDGRGSPKRQQELAHARGAVSPVRKVTVMNSGHRKHSKEIQRDGSPHGNRTPAHPNDCKAAEMQGDKRHHSKHIDLVRLTTQPLNTARAVVRIDPLNQGVSDPIEDTVDHRKQSRPLHSGRSLPISGLQMASKPFGCRSCWERLGKVVPLTIIAGKRTELAGLGCGLDTLSHHSQS